VAREPEDNTMSLESSEKINRCLERVADLRARSDAETNSALRAELRDYEVQWLDILETYQFLDEAGRYLSGMRAEPPIAMIRRSSRFMFISTPDGR
jgi:hypothetical protein